MLVLRPHQAVAAQLVNCEALRELRGPERTHHSPMKRAKGGGRRGGGGGGGGVGVGFQRKPKRQSQYVWGCPLYFGHSIVCVNSPNRSTVDGCEIRLAPPKKPSGMMSSPANTNNGVPWFLGANGFPSTVGGPCLGWVSKGIQKEHRHTLAVPLYFGHSIGCELQGSGTQNGGHQTSVGIHV